MNNTIEDGFNGWLMPDGEMISFKDVDRMYSIIVQRRENQAAIVQCLRELAEECIQIGYHKAAHDYLEKILALTDVPSKKAECFLGMGIAMENAGDYQAALEAYQRAFHLPQRADDVWYFLNNNRAFCLCRLGRYREAEIYCRAAIGIDPTRHNAYKNLGVALENLGMYLEAAKAYLTAMRRCPQDRRAGRLLRMLMACHPEVLNGIPDLWLQIWVLEWDEPDERRGFRVQ